MRRKGRAAQAGLREVGGWRYSALFPAAPVPKGVLPKPAEGGRRGVSETLGRAKLNSVDVGTRASYSALEMPVHAYA